MGPNSRRNRASKSSAGSCGLVALSGINHKSHRPEARTLLTHSHDFFCRIGGSSDWSRAVVHPSQTGSMSKHYARLGSHVSIARAGLCRCSGALRCGACSAVRTCTPWCRARLLGSRQLVTWGQLTVAIASCVILAVVVSRSLKTRIGRIGGVAAVLLLGSCLDVVQWDRLIGTESLSISLGVMVVAAAFWLRERLTPWRAATFCTLAFVWGMLRDANAIVIGVWVSGWPCG
jgi:hypothetical protein